MAKYKPGETASWTHRGKKKTGIVRAIIKTQEWLDHARDRAQSEHGELDFKRLQVTAENQVAFVERYLIEVRRLVKTGRYKGLIDSPDWVTPTTKLVDGDS